jgi:hypothetical protein
MRGHGRSSDHADTSLAAFLARRVEAQFEEVTIRVIRVRQQLQRTLRETLLNGVRLEAPTPRSLVKMSHRMMQQSAEDIQSVIPGRQNRLMWQEFQNKLQAFYLFEHVDSALNFPPIPNTSLNELVAAISHLDPYFAVWSAEGLGHHYADAYWERHGTPRNILCSDQSTRLPPASLIPLHAGMGLCFADRLLRFVKSEADIPVVLQSFARLCRANSQHGYFGAAYESLGMVVRNLYPQVIDAIDRHLLQADSELASYFWHGIGRAIYFAPTHFLSGFRQTWEGSQQEPPHSLGKANAAAGLAWALTLVNIRHPEILEDILRRHGDRLTRSDAFSNGVCSAVMIWHDIVPADRFLSAFCQYRPAASDFKMMNLWNQHVTSACDDALRRYYIVVKRHNRLGELFRYVSLPDWIRWLENADGPSSGPPF